MNKLKILVLSSLFLAGCAGSLVQQIINETFPNSPENYQSAGFKSYDQVELFLPNYLYFAFNLSDAEWKTFYKKFPEYWIDVQNGKKMAFINDFNSGYTAYAFMWTTLQRSKMWDAATVERLGRGKVESGDDLFKVVFALGAPDRVIWNNKYEILLYKEGDSYLVAGGEVADVNRCGECCNELPPHEKFANNPPAGLKEFSLSDREVIAKLGFPAKN